MIRTARAAVSMFVVLGLVASVAPANPPAHNNLTAMLDGTQPPVPPKAAFFDGTQPPVPLKAIEIAALMLDGTQPPVPPKAGFFDGTQPPVPPKALAAAV